MVVVSGSENVYKYRNELVKLSDRYAGRFDAVQSRGIGFGEDRICLGFNCGGASLKLFELQYSFVSSFVKGEALKTSRKAEVSSKAWKVCDNTDPLPYVLP